MDAVTKICLTVVTLAFIGALSVLAFSGRDTAALTNVLTVVLNAASVAAGSGALWFAGKAAKKASQAAEQTNGGLDSRIQENVHRALDERNVEVKDSGGQVLQRSRFDRDGRTRNDRG